MDSHEPIDVFISYPHRDNQPLIKENDDSEGWITIFHQYLTHNLGAYLGRDPVIWRDDKLRGNDEFDDEIVAGIRQAKVIVTVMSPSYLKSEWCMKELQGFLKVVNSNNTLYTGNKSRIFKVVKTYVPLGEHPDGLRDLIGYDFFQIGEKERPVDFIPNEDLPNYSKFVEKLKDVAWDIHNLLKDIDQQMEEDEKPQPIPPGRFVYLAETTSDLEEKRGNISRELKQHGYTILPDRNLPYISRDGNFKETVCSYLKRCKLSIHLVGKQYPLVPEGEESSIVDLQIRLASERCNQNQLSRLIWIVPDVDQNGKIDKRQKEYIVHLLDNPPAEGNTELLDTKTTIEDFKTITRDTLKKINRPTNIKEPDPENESPPTRVYLVYDEEDRDMVKKVSNCLDREEIEVMHPLSKGSASQRRMINKENILLCDAMMIYYDHGSEFWLKSNMNEVRKAPTYGRNERLKASIFITGEKTDEKENLRTREAEIIREYNPSFCEALSGVINQIQT